MVAGCSTESGASLYRRPVRRELGWEVVRDHLPFLLTAIAMASSTVALWVYIQELPMFVLEGIFEFSQVIKPPLYYFAHGLALLCACGAGVVAMPRAPVQILRRYGPLFLLFLAAGGLMALRGYSLAAAASTQIFSSTGPFVCLISVLIFAGAQPGSWKTWDKLLLCMAAAFSLLCAIAMLRLESLARWDASLALTQLLNALYWPAAWMLVRPAAERPRASWLRFVPLGVYAAGSILTQTRLNWIMILAALGAHLYIQQRRRIMMLPKVLLGAALATWLFLFSMVFLGDTTYVQNLQFSAQELVGRWDEDTRSDQMIQFFSDVQLRELLLGRGSLATWYWNGVEWPGGTDIGYLSLLFFGGVPLLLTYVALHIRPALHAIRRPQSEWQRACAAIVLLWGLRMFSSSFPGLNVEYFPVLLCVGGCLGIRLRAIHNRVQPMAARV